MSDTLRRWGWASLVLFVQLLIFFGVLLIEGYSWACDVWRTRRDNHRAESAERP